MSEKTKVKIDGAKIVTQDTFKKTASETITVVPGTKRSGFSVVKVEGSRDIDFGQGEYDRKTIVEVHEVETEAKDRANELTQTDGFEETSISGGDTGEYVSSWRSYETGQVVLRLCLAEGDN